MVRTSDGAPLQSFRGASPQTLRGRDAELAIFGQHLDQLLSGIGSVLLVKGGAGLDGNGGANYNVTTNLSSASGIINQAPLTASITASIIGTPTKPYDSTTAATLEHSAPTHPDDRAGSLRIRG